MIYDCFPFFDESMLLEIRLKELYSVIDKFVLVESLYTFSGRKKRLYYDEIKDNEIFAPFKDKIIHIVFNDLLESDRWAQEIAQRNAIIEGLSDAKPNDIIIVSDIDEIIRSEVIEMLRDINEPGRLIMKMYYYYFNCLTDDAWIYPAFCRFRDYQTGHLLRNTGGNYHKNSIINAGWHFSYLMPPDKIAEKLEAFAHAEYDTDYYKNLNRIKKCIDNNTDLFDRQRMKFSIEPLDAPKCVMENRDKYKNFIKTRQFRFNNSRMLLLQTNIKE